MTNANRIEPVVDRLEYAIGKGSFPNQYHQWATHLLSHLRKPVQVVTIGLPDSGKSTLINMMMGEQIISKFDSVPVIEIAHGPRARTMFEIEDGSVIRANGHLRDASVPAGAVRARQEMPLPGLLRQSYVEIGLTGDFGHQKSIVHWATQFADIILWCTQGFGEVEQKLWSAVPDEIKDHSFLVLTMADRQLMKGTLSQMIADLEPTVAEEFLGLYPMATIQAIAARNSKELADKGLWKSSGGKALVESLAHKVELGRTADVDQARMLLNRFAQSDTGVPAAPEAKAPTTVAAPKPAEDAARKPDQANTRIQSGKLSGESEKILSNALLLLQENAEHMLDTMFDGGQPDADKILNKCVETAKALSQILMDGDPADPIVRETRDDALESEELLLLFQLEKGEEAAEDAVTLLLQLKKEIADKA